MRKDLKQFPGLVHRAQNAARDVWDQRGDDLIEMARDDEGVEIGQGFVEVDREEVLEFILNTGFVEEILQENRWTAAEESLWTSLAKEEKMEVLTPAFPYSGYGG